MEKKTNNTFTQRLRTISETISDAKIIIGAVIVVAGTIVSVFFGAVNYVISIKNAPLISRVEAIESRDRDIKEALVDLQNSDVTINSKLDTLLIKLIPNYSNRDNIDGKP